MTRAGSIAAAAGGIAWLGLIPASVLLRRGYLSYDGYYRWMAVPLLLFVVAWLAWRPLWPRGQRAALGWWLTLGGLALVFAGDALEFWGAWLTGNTNAYEAYGSGQGQWWGSNAGWSLVVFGFMLLLAGGVTAAVAARRARLVPLWGAFVLGLLGFGVMSGNFFHEASPAWTVPVFGAFGLGWIGLGLVLGPHDPSSRTTS